MKCQAINKNGEPCGAAPLRGGEYCYMHDPAKAAERQQARKMGGYRSRRGHSSAAAPRRVKSLRDVLRLLDYTLAETLELDNSISRGRLLVALAGEYVRALDVGDLETRLKRIEEKLGL